MPKNISIKLDNDMNIIVPKPIAPASFMRDLCLLSDTGELLSGVAIAINLYTN